MVFRSVRRGCSIAPVLGLAALRRSSVKSYARKIWLAGLGAYTKVGQEGSEYFQELIKAGQTARASAR